MKQEGYHTITIFQSTDLGKIYMAHNQLENAGIESFVKNEFRAYNVGYIELQIYQKDTRAALEILRELYPEEFDRRVLCPYCGSDLVRISSDTRTPFWKRCRISLQRLKYQFQHELPEGTYLCENCHRQFSYQRKGTKS